MSVATCTAERPVQSAAVSVTTTDLLDTPLPRLLADVGAELVESSIREPGFTGYVWREGGRFLLAMPAGQPLAEREMVARAMLGRALRVPMPELPEPYRLADLADL